MMNLKLLISLFLAIFALSFSSLSAHAASPSPSASNTPLGDININKQIDDLKNKVASKVAELKLVEKRGIIGTVTDVSGTQITLNDLKGDIRYVDVDEFTDFSSPDAKGSFGISDIKKGDMVGVLGLYNKDSRRTLARFVNVLDLPKVITGVISDKDEKNFSIIVTTSDEKVINVNVENLTTTYSVSNGTLTKSGFSKVTTGVNVIVTGFDDPKEKNTLTASKILFLPNVPADPSIKVVEKIAPTGSSVPSTGSGVKLTPIGQ